MDVKIIHFQQHGDARGNLVAAELGKELPFPVRRVYYIYGVKGAQRRGFHAHKALNQVLIAIAGSCKILLDNGKEQTVVPLTSPTEGLFIGVDTWREMFDFSEDAVLVSLASAEYDESDYIRDHDAFLKYLEEKNK